MSIKTYRPTTPARRQMTVSGFDGVAKHVKPEKTLTEVLKKHSGRNSYGRITVAAKVRSVQSTLSFCPTPASLTARCRALVPEARATA